MKTVLKGLLFCFIIHQGILAGPNDSDWIQLFNGENLDGWDFKIRYQDMNVDPNNTFHVEDGIFKVDYSNYTNFNGEPFGHIFYDTPYSYYLLSVEYQFVGDQVPGGPGWAFENNGLMLHGQNAESMGTDQNFPMSIEVQLLALPALPFFITVRRTLGIVSERLLIPLITWIGFPWKC
jgi:hypothetical protein